MHRNIYNMLIQNSFLNYAALAQVLNWIAQASRRRCPLAKVHDGFPQQRG
jgi:hypothetical protein